MSSDCDCTNITVQVHAGTHPRDNVCVSMPCHLLGCDTAHVVTRLDENGNEIGQIPCQHVASQLPTVDGANSELVWLVDHLDAGETATFAIGCQSDLDVAPGVEIDVKENQQADFLIGDELFTSYIVKPGIARPFCYPVVGPNGLNIARDIVYLRDGDFGSTYDGVDHIHHKGIWIAQGDVNGIDNWSEMEGHGRTINRSLSVESEGPLFAQLHAVGDWQTANGAHILQEDTFIRVYNTPGSARLMDLATVWTAGEKGVFFGDTKEAGTVSSRLKESMEERNGGTIRNAYGAIGEAENWGKPAPWVDYYGPLEGRVCGVSIMDHPTNLRHPATWHVRSYGLFTANQWGLHDYTDDWAVRGDYALPAGQSLCFRFRLYVHEGDTEAAGVSARYLDWVFPPQVSVVE